MELSMQELSNRVESASRSLETLAARRQRLTEGQMILEKSKQALRTLQEDNERREQSLRNEEASIEKVRLTVVHDMDEALRGIAAVRESLLSGLASIEETGQQVLAFAQDDASE